MCALSKFENNTRTILIMTLLIITILKTLNMGCITSYDITLSLILLINDFTYNNIKWKHVFNISYVTVISKVVKGKVLLLCLKSNKSLLNKN